MVSPKGSLPPYTGEAWPTSLARTVSFFLALTFPCLSPDLPAGIPAHIRVSLGQLEKGLGDVCAICSSEPRIFPVLVWV